MNFGSVCQTATWLQREQILWNINPGLLFLQRHFYFSSSRKYFLTFCFSCFHLSFYYPQTFTHLNSFLCFISCSCFFLSVSFSFLSLMFSFFFFFFYSSYCPSSFPSFPSLFSLFPLALPLFSCPPHLNLKHFKVHVLLILPDLCSSLIWLQYFNMSCVWCEVCPQRAAAESWDASLAVKGSLSFSSHHYIP